MQLKKELTLIHIFSISTGALISSGLFILPGLARGLAGPSVIISYLLAGLLASTGMLSIAEITTAMPKAGGDYFFIMRSFGPLTGTIAGLFSWFALSMKTAFALIGMSAFTVLLPGFANIDIRIIGVTLCVIFAVINLIGVKEAGRTQVYLVLGLIGVLAFYLARGFPEVSAANFENFAPYGPGRIFTTAGFVFVAYGGLLGIASVSEEAREPGKTVPRGLILSIVATTLLYILVVFVTIGVVPENDFDPESLTPISDAAAMFMANPGVMLLSAAAILAFISTANAGILSASRYLLGLSRDRLLPDFLGNINRRWKTPHFPITITALLIASVLFLQIDVLVKAASAVVIFTNIFINLCLIILREGRIKNYRPTFRAPLYPWLQIAGIMGFSAMLTGIGAEALAVGLLLFCAGVIIFLLHGRQRTKSEHALLHLLERITNRDLQSGMLEYELKQIIRDRDNIKRDRFDKMVENSIVLDVEGEKSVEEFYKTAAEKLSERLGIETEKIHKLLMERERQSGTVVEPGVAIPHIIIEGQNKAEMLIARAGDGIIFEEAGTPVNTVFIFAGSKDERNFHLRALSALAQIIQDEHFRENWAAAKNERELRDLILLGERKRPADEK